MTDEQIVRALARLQARGEPGAAQARAFVVGDWLPRWEWGPLYAALLKVGGDAGRRPPPARRFPASVVALMCILLDIAVFNARSMPR